MTSPNLVKNSHIKSDQFKHLNLLRIISAHAQRNKSFSAHDTAHCRKKLFGIAWPAKCLGRNDVGMLLSMALVAPSGTSCVVITGTALLV